MPIEVTYRGHCNTCKRFVLGKASTAYHAVEIAEREGWRVDRDGFRDSPFLWRWVCPDCQREEATTDAEDA